MSHLGVPGPIGGGAPRPQKIFWEVQEVPIGPPEKMKWLLQLLHGFFEPKCSDQNRDKVNHRVKLQPACLDSRSEKILKIFHLVRSMGPNEWETA